MILLLGEKNKKNVVGRRILTYSKAHCYDQVMVAKLYEASKAGVKIDCIVRGMCRIRTGIPNVRYLTPSPIINSVIR